MGDEQLVNLYVIRWESEADRLGRRPPVECMIAGTGLAWAWCRDYMRREEAAYAQAHTPVRFYLRPYGEEWGG